ncbi:hypothetical protein ANANG_G00306240 [Anguilla anguilla]|uniref:Uncharacterized protein n=1 Tax=Anguilla anguilla TaxID=7936 RepID=A0A9D3RIL6_ANGAN|nr:hypothetical protein ANANG_G00306240 [Anguilla anguilla]
MDKGRTTSGRDSQDWICCYCCGTQDLEPALQYQKSERWWRSQVRTQQYSGENQRVKSQEVDSSRGKSWPRL